MDGARGFLQIPAMMRAFDWIRRARRSRAGTAISGVLWGRQNHGPDPDSGLAKSRTTGLARSGTRNRQLVRSLGQVVLLGLGLTSMLAAAQPAETSPGLTNPGVRPPAPRRPNIILIVA